jgi:hypothetical protein
VLEMVHLLDDLLELDVVHLVHMKHGSCLITGNVFVGNHEVNCLNELLLFLYGK